MGEAQPLARRSEAAAERSAGAHCWAKGDGDTDQGSVFPSKSLQ